MSGGRWKRQESRPRPQPHGVTAFPFRSLPALSIYSSDVAWRDRMACAAGAVPSLLHRSPAPVASHYCGRRCRCRHRHRHRPALESSVGGGARRGRNWGRASSPSRPRGRSSAFLLMGGLLGLTGFSGLLNNLGYAMDIQIHTMGGPQGNIAAPNEVAKPKQGPDHLLVLVHGILASPSDWLYAESELKRQLGSNFLIYASSSNTYTKTLTGIDGAGRRLADEVIQVVQKIQSLKRISFLAHSLGGLIARYAVAVLYSPNVQTDGHDDDIANSGSGETKPSKSCPKFGTIAGLEPVNFITLATPHLGVRGRKQLPFLLGVPILERLAPPIAPLIIGRTGCQLFLTDGKPSKLPLLLRMASDCEDLKFISSLGAFRSRVLYANVAYDHMVGWRTSSIRRETELLKPPRRSLEGYKHVVDLEYCPPVSSEKPHFTLEAVKAKAAAQVAPNSEGTSEYYHIMEEEMIHGLQRLGWTKVDVSFHSAFWPFFAHNNIHVKNEWVNNAGAGIIAHVADNLKRQESCGIIPASL